MAGKSSKNRSVPMILLMNKEEKRAFLLRYAANPQASQSPDEPHWVTIHGKDGKGVHILIDKSGMVLEGPDGMKGKNMNSLSHSSASPPKTAPPRTPSLFDEEQEDGRSFGPTPAEPETEPPEPAQIAKTPEELLRELNELRTETFDNPEEDGEGKAAQIPDTDQTNATVFDVQRAKMEAALESSEEHPLTAFNSPAAVEQRRQAIQEMTEQKKKEVQLAAQRLGISPDEFISRCEAKIKKEFENAGLYTRITPSALLEVLKSGRFKSQFETGSTGGYYEPKIRANAEFNMFGYENDASKNAEERPIYGFIDYKDGPIGESTRSTRVYGACIVQFKEDVKKRTTFTSTDSLDVGHQKKVACSSMLNPNVTTISDNFDEFLDIDECLIVPEGEDYEPLGSPLEFSGYSYTEAQFHGGLTVDDIERVFIQQEEIFMQGIKQDDIQDLIKKGLSVVII